MASSSVRAACRSGCRPPPAGCRLLTPPATGADSCGPSQDLAEWARLLNATGNHVLIENCFDNSSFPRTKSGVDDGTEVVTDEDCPMNMYRSGGDMRADWPLMLRRLKKEVEKLLP